MKSLLLGCLGVFWMVAAGWAAEVKLAVIGDSISTGAHAEDRGRNGYPARLITLFAKKGERKMKVFALSGHTLLLETKQSLMKKPGYREIVDYAADVVVIMLGTNDSALNEKNRHWEAHEDLEKDLRKMIGDLKAANPEVMIHLAGPPPMFPDKKGLKPDRVKDLTERKARLPEVERVMSAVAKQEPRVVHHGMARVFGAEETSDGVHPTTFAHEKIAHFLDELLKLGYDEEFEVREQLEKAGAKVAVGGFSGFAKYDFQLPGESVACTVVAPEQTAEGRPWIWRARFFGHQPELDLSLLDRGWHVAYCDVSNLYGAPEAMRRWDSFYAFATGNLGLGAKPVLEGMSRGGLPIFRWASLHPDQVAAVYGDNPVCDFRSWPGGQKGKRSKGDWNRLLGAWSVSEEEAMKHDQVVDWLEPLAAAKVPVALVLGLADDVVPPTENGDAVAARYAELGGPVKVWRKPGAGHHPHGLHPADPLRRYLLAASGAERNPAAIASPSSEYRGAAAGWGKGTWWDAFDRLKKVVAENPRAEVVFLGDSITQGLTGHGERVAKSGGKRAIDRHFGDRGAISLGLSGERTEHLLWRIENGQFDGLSPEWVVLMIGVNNINAGGHTGEETAEGTVAVVKALREVLSETKLLVLGCFPVGLKADDPRRSEADALHQGVAGMADGKRVIYRDLRSLFLNPDGTGNGGMGRDGIHITVLGQDVWMRAIKEILRKP